MVIDRAVILAGGRGRRLAPYTFVIPKPIVPIGTTPILDIVLRQLAYYGFKRATIALGHMSEIVRAVAGDGSKHGLAIDYSDETVPLGTIGPLHLIGDLPEHFLVMNADLLTDLDFRVLAGFHASHGCIATIATCDKTTQLELGVLEADESGNITRFTEKPLLYHRVSMGIYLFDRRVLDFVPPGTHFGFDTLMHTLLARGERITSYHFGGRWLDIGVPADYDRAQEEIERDRAAYMPWTTASV